MFNISDFHHARKSGILYIWKRGRTEEFLVVLRASGLCNVLKECIHTNGEQLYIFGDKACVTRPRWQVGFDSITETPAQEISNTERAKWGKP